MKKKSLGFPVFNRFTIVLTEYFSFFKGKEIAKMDLDQTLESNEIEGLSLFIKEEKTDNTSKFFYRVNFDFEVNGDWRRCFIRCTPRKLPDQLLVCRIGNL